MISKYTKIAVGAALFCNFAQGALYTLNNGTGSTAAGVQTTEGYVFRSGTTAGQTTTTGNVATFAGPGVLAFGFFSTDDLASVSEPTTLVSLFTQFGAGGTFGAASTGGNRSVFSRAENQTINPTFAGKSIYFFAGNGSTFANSTQFLVAKMDSQTFVAGDDTANAITPKVISINPGNSTVLIGGEISNVFTTNTDSSTTAGWQMAALVPETSTSLLGAIGALALLRRRRN